MFNVQHDCRMAGCEATAVQARIQERQVTDQMERLVTHKDEDHFVVNTFALHNAMLLRSVLPRSLISPALLYLDRKMHHKELAKKLRETQSIKRAKTQEKRKATAASNRAKKQARQAEIDAAEQQHIPQDEWEEEFGAQSDSEEEVEERSTRPPKRPRTL